MTEQEILRQQELNGQRSFLLVLVGRFLHAYGNGAFALSRTTGYRVMRKQRKWGEVLTCGFPIDRFDQVRDRIREAGGDISSQDSKTWMFRGLDGTPDSRMVCEPAPKPEPRPQAAPTVGQPAAESYGWLAEAVRGFNLSQSTPMDAMLFVSTLQHRLNDTDTTTTTTIACESPVGHGLQE